MFQVASPVRARVTFAAHGQCRVLVSNEEKQAVIAGKVEGRLVAGDWVELRGEGHAAGSAETDETPVVVERVLPRRTWLARKEAGRRSRPQVLAANVDVVVVVSALDAPVNARRIERFFAMAWDGGARPVLALNKADTCADIDRATEPLRSLGALATVVTSAKDGRGVDQLRALARDGTTLALVGPSGVGKSALTNCLVARDAQREAGVRETDRKGRHTTTHRELFAIDGGGWVIDTPGLRELGLWTEDDAPRGFDEIDALGARCRFRDCAHDSEPGCAVRAAIEGGGLDPDRVAAWSKLAAETRSLSARREPWREKSRLKALMRALRAHPKNR